jgi:hypothetical protein
MFENSENLNDINSADVIPVSPKPTEPSPPEFTNDQEITCVSLETNKPSEETGSSHSAECGVSPSEVIDRDMEVEELSSPALEMNSSLSTKETTVENDPPYELSDSDMEDDAMASPTSSSTFIISNKEALAISSAKNRMKRKAEAPRAIRYTNNLERAKTARPTITKKATSMKMRDASVTPQKIQFE